MTKTILSVYSILIFQFGFAQSIELNLVSGKYSPEPQDLALLESDNNYAYVIVSNGKVLTNDDKADLKNNGIELGYYIPESAFYASINLTVFDAQSHNESIHFYELLPAYKKSALLSNQILPEWALVGNSDILLNIMTIGTPTDETIEKIESLGATIVQRKDESLRILMPVSTWTTILDIEQIFFVEEIGQPSEPVNLVERTNHRSNFLDSDSDNGLKYDATGVTVMMADDGFIGEHIDFEGRIDQSYCSSCSDDLSLDHGDHVAGTIMGAGNLNSKGKGMAYGADLIVTNAWTGTAAFNGVPGLIVSDSLVITSRSFGNGCTGGYNTASNYFDKQVRQNPTILHICAAGNYGYDNCFGSGLNGWFSQSAEEQESKNTISVGNLSHLDGLNNSSSKGPAKDGRVKPDICGVGTSVFSTLPDNEYGVKTGTSMACPGVSGTTAQIHHAYRELNGGEIPKAGLMKAILLNTADDLGNPGPDFSFGWGRINARRALEAIESQSYFTDTVVSMEIDSFEIVVPSGAKEIKIMAYWNDYEASPSANQALVNDLNMTVKTPSGDIYDPWILDPSPNIPSITSDAVRGVDNLNNMEQFTIKDPEPGVYQIKVEGYNVFVGPQEYFVTYEVQKQHLTLTYPNGGEGWAASTEYIRWDASEDTLDFTFDFSSDNGATWTSLGTAPAGARVLPISVPTIVSGKCLIRVGRDGIYDISDNPFSIIQVATQLEIAWACPDSLKFQWADPMGTATQGFEVDRLGTKYMDSIAYSPITEIVLQIPSTEEAWLSVKCLGIDSAVGRRANAIYKAPGQFGCTWSDPIAVFESSCDVSSVNECFTMINSSLNTDAGSTYQWYFPTGTPQTSTDINPTVCFDASGYHDAALVVQNSVGSDSIYMIDIVNVKAAQGMAYLEGFEDYTSLTNTENWEVLNNGGPQFYVVSSASHTGVKSVKLTNYNQDAGEVDELISAPIDLSGVDESAGEYVTVSFRYSYKKKDTDNTEWLKLLVKDGCESSWTTRKVIQGNNLSSDVQTTPWTPQVDEDWVTVHVTNVTSSFWTPSFQMKFEFTSDGGNNLYLDDINIYKGDPSEELIGLNELNAIESISLYPNPVGNEVNLLFESNTSRWMNFKLVDINGRLLKEVKVFAQSGSNLVQIDTHEFNSGMYFIVTENGGNSQLLKFTKN